MKNIIGEDTISFKNELSMVFCNEANRTKEGQKLNIQQMLPNARYSSTYLNIFFCFNLKTFFTEIKKILKK